MNRSHTLYTAALATLCASPVLAQDKGSAGERVERSAISPIVLESMDVVRERAKNMPKIADTRGLRMGRDGRWFIPQLSAKTPAHSGRFAVVNEWGDIRIGLGFDKPVALEELYAAGHGVAPARAIQIVGYRGKKEVERTDWIALTPTHAKLKLGFDAVDRIVVLSIPHTGRMGFFALDDIRFRESGRKEARVLDFEDTYARRILTGSKYAGLRWESGSGYRAKLLDRQIVDDIVPAPEAVAPEAKQTVGGALPTNLANATAPRRWDNFVAVTQGDPGATLVPPDTHGCNGPNHYVAIVNANLSAYEKATKRRVVNVSLRSFWGFNSLIGDPRIVFDPHSQRYVAMATTFSRSRSIYFAVSRTNNPAGAWYKFNFRTDQGSDAGRWPDYPTLGVDKRGIYTSAYMVGRGARMTIWAIDKAPLIGSTPRVGTITAFRSLPWEGAIQPCTTYGDPGSQWLVSRRSSTALRLRRITGPLTAPRLVEAGFASIPRHSSPPSAPALGSTTPLSTIDTRPMNAVFRNGSVYTVHGVNAGGKAAVRWYEITTSPVRTRQVGTITDNTWHYFYGSIAVDALGNVGLGFSGSHSRVYASTFLAGRLATDTLGMTSKPELVTRGTGPWNRRDGAGRNRFGDYSHIDVDATDDCGFWSTQEFILRSNVWRTDVTRFGFESFNYGTGLAGRNGIPTLRTTGRPVIGRNLVVEVGNSRGATTAGLLLIGSRKASIPVLGGTLLVAPLINLTLPIPSPRANVTLPYPNDKALVCKPIYMQSAQLDAAATQSFAFSAGLEIRAGSR